MPYSTANDERTKTLLWHSIIGGVYHSRLGDIIASFTQY